MLRKAQKIQLISGLFFSLASSSFASGFYIGAGAGPDMAKFDVNSRVRQFQDSHFTLNVKNDEELAGTGVFGTIFAGYGKSFQVFYSKPQLYLALELNANVSNLIHKNDNGEFVHKNDSATQFEMTRNFGISIIPGLQFNPDTLFYGRVGYSNGHFKVSSTDTSLGTISENLNGTRWGLGMQQTVYQQFAIRLEYSQITYTHAQLFTLDKSSNTSKYTSIYPRTSEVEVGLVFGFC